MKTFPVSLLAVALCLLARSESRAGIWYVSPAGVGGGATPAAPTQPQVAITMSAPGDQIVFSAGVYVLGSAPGVQMQLVTKSLTLEGAPGGGTVLNLNLPAGNINISTASDITISNMVIQNGAATRCGVGVGSRLILRDSTVRWFTSPQSVFVSGGSTVQIERCRFEANVVGITVGNGSDISVTDSEFINHATAGIDLQDSTTASRVTESVFVNNKDGIHIQPAFGDTDSLIDRNEFYGNGCGVAMLSVPGGFVARDHVWYNKFFSSTSSAVYSGYGNNQADIDGNWIQANNRGIYLQGSLDTVHNNVVVDSAGTGYGIEVAGSAAIVAHNTVAYNASHGILARSADGSHYVNNISVQNGGYGLRAAASPAAQVGCNNSFLNAVNFGGPFVGLGGNMSVAAGFTSAYDFHLAAGSAMVNAAGFALFPEARDFDGKPRPAGMTDIGAFEQ